MNCGAAKQHGTKCNGNNLFHAIVRGFSTSPPHSPVDVLGKNLPGLVLGVSCMLFRFGSKFDGFWYRPLVLYQCCDEDLEHRLCLLQILLNPFLRCIFGLKSFYSTSNFQTRLSAAQIPWPSLRQYCTRNSVSSCRLESLQVSRARDNIPTTIHLT